MRTALWAALFLSASGCARTARYDVVRPAMLSLAPHGNTVAVESEAAANPMLSDQAASEVRSRVAGSLNRAIRLLANGAGVIVSVAVVRDEYGETMQENQHQCSHTVQNNGRSETQSYSCTDLTRVGVEQLAVRYRIVTAAGQVLFENTYERSDSARTQGRRSPYPNENSDPGLIDRLALTGPLLDDTISTFSRVILPWTETVEVQFVACPGEPRCDQAWESVQRRQLEGADALFSMVIGVDGRQVAPAEVERVATALYNRSTVRMLRAQYIEAYVDIRRALELRSDHTEWQERSQQLLQLSRDQQALQAQQTPAPQVPAP